MVDRPAILDRTALATRLGIDPDSVAREVRRGQIPRPDASTTAAPRVAEHTVVRYHAEVDIRTLGSNGRPVRRTVQCAHDHSSRQMAAECGRSLAAAAESEGWYEPTIDEWEKTRPGKGAGRPRKEVSR